MRHLFWTVLVVALLGCSGADERKAAHFERGKELLAAQKFEKATLEFKNVLKIDPSHVEAEFLLGQAMEQLGDYSGAARRYQAVVSARDVHLGALVRLGRLYLFGDRVGEALVLAEKGLEYEPDNLDARVLRAGALMRSGDYSEAQRDLHAVLASEPAHVDALSLFAALLVTEGQTSAAIELLEGGIRANREDPELLRQLAGIEASTGATDRAAARFEELLALDPKSVESRLEVAGFYWDAGRRSEAERTLREGIEHEPGEVRLKLTLAQLLAEAGERARSVSTLRGFIDKAPDIDALKFGLASVYEGMSEFDEAKAQYREVIRQRGTSPDGLVARNRLALLLVREARYADASALLAEVLEHNPLDAGALVLRGTIALETGRPGDAIVDLRTVLRDHPNDTHVLRLLARVHWMNEEREQSKTLLRKAIKTNPGDIALRLELAEMLARSGESAAAKDEIERALALEPSHRRALEALARLQVDDSEWEVALRTAARIEALHPGWFLADYVTGLAEQGLGRHDAAARALEAARAKNPGAVEVLAAQLRTDVALGRRASALARINEALVAQPDRPVLLNLRGELLARFEAYGEARESFEAAIERMPAWELPYRNLAALHLARGEPQAAIETYRSGLAATSGAASLVFELAERYESQGDHELAIAEYEALLAREPDRAAAANNLAMLLLTYRRDPDSLERARALTANFAKSGNPDYLDTLAWVQLQRGEVEGAIVLLERVVRLAPEVAVYRYHLGMAYHRRGDFEAARENLRLALAADVLFRGLDDARATLATLGGG